MPTIDPLKKQQTRMGRVAAEIGEDAFTTTASSVEIGVKMYGRTWATLVTPKTQPSPYEQFWTDGVITSQGITVSRQIIPILFSVVGDDAVNVASNNVAKLPICILPVAAYLKRVRWYNKTIAGGSPLINIGDTRCAVTGKTYDKTGGTVEQMVSGTAADYSLLTAGDKVWITSTNVPSGGIYTVAVVAADGSYIGLVEALHTADDTSVTVSTLSAYISNEEAIAQPASGASKSITAATDFADNAYPLVPAGAVLMATTTGGSASAPSGVMVQVELEVPFTSGLAFWNAQFGL